jgi:hypothetical protein
VVGGSALVAAIITALELRPIDAIGSAAAGYITVGWLTIEVGMIGLGSWVQAVWWLVVGEGGNDRSGSTVVAR